MVFRVLVRANVFSEEPMFSFFENWLGVIFFEMFGAKGAYAIGNDSGHECFLFRRSRTFHLEKLVAFEGLFVGHAKSISFLRHPSSALSGTFSLQEYTFWLFLNKASKSAQKVLNAPLRSHPAP